MTVRPAHAGRALPYSLGLWADWRAAILAAVHTNDRDWLDVIFEGVEAAGPWTR